MSHRNTGWLSPNDILDQLELKKTQLMQGAYNYAYSKGLIF